VLIDATGGGEPPSTLPRSAVVRVRDDGALRIAVPPRESDAALRALLAARPPWHVRSVRQAAADGPGEPDRPREPRSGDSREPEAGGSRELRSGDSRESEAGKS
jgi:ABC-2 type transport system ATP-binding protein